MQANEANKLAEAHLTKAKKLMELNFSRFCKQMLASESLLPCLIVSDVMNNDGVGMKVTIMVAESKETHLKQLARLHELNDREDTWFFEETNKELEDLIKVSISKLSDKGVITEKERVGLLLSAMKLKIKAVDMFRKNRNRSPNNNNSDYIKIVVE